MPSRKASSRWPCRRAIDPMLGQVVVPTPQALDLVKYLQSLDHTYPVLPPAPQP